jgi:hypothetical protein
MAKLPTLVKVARSGNYRILVLVASAIILVVAALPMQTTTSPKLKVSSV